MSRENPSSDSSGEQAMTTDKKQITRNRTSYSCQTCRRRKVRCDKQHPRCGGCIKAGETCVYGEFEKPSDDSKRQLNGANSAKSRKRRATNDEDSDTQSTSPALKSIELKLTQLTSLVHDINRLTPVSMSNSPDSTRLQNLQATQHNSLTGDAGTHEHYQTNVHHDDSFDTLSDHDASWKKVLGRLEHLNTMLRTGIRAQSNSYPHRPTNGSADQQTNSQSINLPENSHPAPYTDLEVPDMPEGVKVRGWRVTEKDIIAPSEEESAVLFRSWLWSIYPVLPIISPLFVLERYTAFQQWYKRGLDKGEPNPDPNFMPFLRLIWYTGYENLSERAKRKWFPWAVENTSWLRILHSHLEQHLEMMKVEAASSTFSLAAAVTNQFLAVGGQDIMRCHMRNTLNLRAAQRLGLHNERTLKELNPIVAETRRRLWWEVLSLDTSISTVSGMPVVLDERYTDTKMISELKELYLGTEAAQEYEATLEKPGSSPERPDDPVNWQTSSPISVYHMVAKARHMLTVCTKKVLKANMSANPMTTDELKEVRKSMLQVGNDVRTIIDRIQTRGIPELDFVPEANPPSEIDHLDGMGEKITSDEIIYFFRGESDVKTTNPVMKYHRATTIAFHKWARVMLSMMIDRLDCISYAPFLKNSKSRLWAVARNCALRSCHGYMRKFLCLAEDPELRRFKWAWASTFHPMHATIIMLIDVHDRPHSTEAPRSRAMIDKMFSLTSMPISTDYPQYGPTFVAPLKEGGDEAWTMLRKLRHKAWQNAGLDPDVLWTEEDQTAVGVGKPLRDNDLFVRSLREDIILKHKQRKDRENGHVSKSPAYESVKHQRLHPSDLGPGDPVSSSFIRDLADFDSMSAVPQILLLRARNDQEIMPYPVTGRNNEMSSTFNAERIEPTKTVPVQDVDGAKVFHIGELIQKIQQTKRPKNSDQSTIEPQKHTSLVSQPLPLENGLLNPDNYDVDGLKFAEQAAYQGFLGAQSTIRTTHDHSIPLQNSAATLETVPAYNSFPNPAPQYQASRSDINAEKHPLVPRSQNYEQRKVAESLSSMSSIPPTLHNEGFTRQKSSALVQGQYSALFDIGQPHPGPTLPDEQQQQMSAPASHMLPSQLSNMSIDNRTANDAFNTGNAMDVDFDWNRWDEMFGQFAGFGEMLMESYDSDFGSDDHGIAGGIH